MYAIKSVNQEWHRMIEMGLALDANMRFFYEPKGSESNDKKQSKSAYLQRLRHAIAVESESFRAGKGNAAQNLNRLNGENTPMEDTLELVVTGYGLSTDLDVVLDDDAFDHTEFLSEVAQNSKASKSEVIEELEAVYFLYDDDDAQASAAKRVQRMIENNSNLTQSISRAWQECAIKLDLAEVYRDIGNIDGAKLLLKEVKVDGDAKQQRFATELLLKL